MKVRCPHCSRTLSVRSRNSEDEDGGRGLIALLFLISGGYLFYYGFQFFFGDVPDAEKTEVVGTIGVSLFLFVAMTLILYRAARGSVAHGEDESAESSPSEHVH